MSSSNKNPSISMSALSLAWMFAALVAAGCGGSSGPARFPLSGVVNLDGQPMPRGTIQFVSTGSEQGAMAVGKIENGKYSIASDAGAAVGKHIVRVYADDPMAFALDDPRAEQKATAAQKAATTVNSVAAKYNEATILKAEVTAAGPNEFSFNVEQRKAEEPATKPGRRVPDF